jgi:hypothetical protein
MGVRSNSASELAPASGSSLPFRPPDGAGFGALASAPASQSYPPHRGELEAVAEGDEGGAACMTLTWPPRGSRSSG